jgi:hypothetical protein
MEHISSKTESDENDETHAGCTAAGGCDCPAERLRNDSGGGYGAGAHRMDGIGQKLNRKVLKKPWDFMVKSGIIIVYKGL